MKKELKWNLQFFAEGEDDIEPSEDEVSEDEEQEDEGKISESVLKRRLASQKKAIEERFQKQIEDLKNAHEIEKQKAKMTKDEQKKFEQEQKDAEIKRLKAELLKNTLTNKASIALAEAGFSADEDLLSFVIREDEELTMSAVKTFTELVEARVSERLKESARQSAPLNGNTTGGTTSFNVADFARENRIIK